MSNPKMFISYSWSSAEHEAWVVKFAEELVSQGIDVILDKWSLRPGNDANAFMESMVTDPDVKKVVLVCDKKYAEKSDKRSGGAGTEAQIISPQLYAKQDQDKFVAVVRERDETGKAYLPVYYGSRIFFDLLDEGNYATEFERLVRWAWDKPLYSKPELGKMPSYLREEGNAAKLATAVPFRRAIEAIRNGRDFAHAATVEYFDTVIQELENFRITGSSTDFDEKFVQSISDFVPYRNELIEVFIAIAAYRCDDEMIGALHRFFERLIPLFSRPEHIMSFADWDFDNYKFIGHELFLYCIGSFLKYSRFDAGAHFVNNEYYVGDDLSNRRNPMASYVGFRNYVSLLKHRNSRLGLRRLSLHADILKSRCDGVGIDFRHLMTADLILYIRSHKGDTPRQWWPETLLYAAFHAVTFEIFARAKSVAYFNRIKSLLGVDNKAELVQRIEKIEADAQRIPRWEHESINPREFIQLDAIATAP